MGLLVSQSFMDGLSEEERATVREAASLALERQREINAENEAEALDVLVERGMKANEIENHAAFRERMKPVYEAYRDAVGSDLMDMALNELEGD